ncbi:ribose-5-phosphate isomerase RpiA [Paracoccaceae bacterium GXU_MW_L88]
MANELSAADRAKDAAARRALRYVEDGMALGLGTGSTAAYFVRALGDMVAEGLNVIGVPTSEATAQLADQEGVKLSTLDELGKLDLTIDGADEIDPQLRLIKGAGAALLREKIVAAASDRMIIIADESKAVKQLGGLYPLPVEIIRFGGESTRRLIAEVVESCGIADAKIVPRKGPDGLIRTDEGNHIVDLHLGAIPQPQALAMMLNQIPGVVENGLFIELADLAIIGNENGDTRLIDVDAGKVESGDETEGGGLFEGI